MKWAWSAAKRFRVSPTETLSNLKFLSLGACQLEQPSSVVPALKAMPSLERFLYCETPLCQKTEEIARELPSVRLIPYYLWSVIAYTYSAFSHSVHFLRWLYTYALLPVFHSLEVTRFHAFPLYQSLCMRAFSSINSFIAHGFTAHRYENTRTDMHTKWEGRERCKLGRETRGWRKTRSKITLESFKHSGHYVLVWWHFKFLESSSVSAEVLLPSCWNTIHQRLLASGRTVLPLVGLVHSFWTRSHVAHQDGQQQRQNSGDRQADDCWNELHYCASDRNKVESPPNARIANASEKTAGLDKSCPYANYCTAAPCGLTNTTVWKDICSGGTLEFF